MLKALAAMALAIGLTGCAVVSQEPLFTAADAAPHGLVDGLWALSGPGCEVTPAAALPDCAAPVVIDHGRMRWDTGAAIAKAAGPMAPSLSALPLPKTSAFRLVEGDPAIVEMINGDTNDAAPPGRAPLKPGYLGLSVLHRTPAGLVDRAAIWPVRCPPPNTPGFTMQAGQCVVDGVEPLRQAAKTPPLLMSAFLTRVGPVPAG